MKAFIRTSASVRLSLSTIVAAAALAALTPLYGQSITYVGSPSTLDFGTLNVCPSGTSSPAPCSTTQTLTYNVTASETLATPKVLMMGAPNLDFQLASGSTCTGAVASAQTCTVKVTFRPLYPGQRKGAVQIADTSGNILATTLLYGNATGPQIGFDDDPHWTPLDLETPVTTMSLGPVDGSGYMYLPSDTYSTEDGRIYYVTKLAPTGGTITTIQALPTYPVDMVLDGAGDLFILLYGGTQIIELVGGKGTPVYLPTPANHLDRLAVDAKGNVFASYSYTTLVKGTYTYHGGVVEFPADGGPQVEFGTGLVSGGPIAVDPAGNIFAADNGGPKAASRLFKIPTDGSPQVLVSGVPTYIAALATDRFGNLFIAGHGVQELPAGGGPLVPINGFGYVSGITTDPSGNIYIGGGYQEAYNPEEAPGSYIDELRLAAAPSLNFVHTAVGNTSATQSVVLRNIGNAPLTGSWTLDSSSGFHQVAGISKVWGAASLPACTETLSLAANAACNLNLAFSPENDAPASGTVAFSDNSLNGGSSAQTIQLSAAGDQPLIQLSGVGVYHSGTKYTFTGFGFPDPDSDTETGIITVTNIGGGALTVSPTWLNDEVFGLDASNCQTELTTGQSCELTFSFSPSPFYGIGTFVSTLEVANNGTITPTVQMTAVIATFGNN